MRLGLVAAIMRGGVHMEARCADTLNKGLTYLHKDWHDVAQSQPEEASEG